MAQQVGANAPERRNEKGLASLQPRQGNQIRCGGVAIPRNHDLPQINQANPWRAKGNGSSSDENPPYSED
jgi:hypothetical protein